MGVFLGLEVLHLGLEFMILERFHIFVVFRGYFFYERVCVVPFSDLVTRF